jgi:hypothetical protein
MAQVVSMSRRIDNGEPLLLRDPPQSARAAGFSVAPMVCDKPECPCTEMWLDIRPANRRDNDTLSLGKQLVGGTVSSSGDNVELARVAGVPAVDDDVLVWLDEQLSTAERQAWLGERWRRMRGQLGDPAYPVGSPPDNVDGLVFFSEVFPWDFDLTVVHQRTPYLVEDMYCLKRRCSCDEIVAQFFNLSSTSTSTHLEPSATPSTLSSAGHARASLRRIATPQLDGEPILRHLWAALLDQCGQAELRNRFKRMRAVAAKVRVAPAPSPTKVGRNEPCPCGSGKKFKRCCGR